MTDQSNDRSLHPAHLKTLQESNLSNGTIKEAGIRSLFPADLTKLFPSFIASKITSAMEIPYPDCGDFARYKLFPPIHTEKGTIKYFQPSDSENHLYIPPRVRAVLQDVTIPLYLVEGEKKCLKGLQEGIFCIGLGGLWNWSDGTEEKTLISDFDQINLKGRPVYLVPDNDFEQPDRHGDPKNLKQAVYELGYRLIDRGAKVFIVELPKEVTL